MILRLGAGSLPFLHWILPPMDGLQLEPWNCCGPFIDFQDDSPTKNRHFPGSLDPEFGIHRKAGTAPKTAVPSQVRLGD